MGPSVGVRPHRLPEEAIAEGGSSLGSTGVEAFPHGGLVAGVGEVSHRRCKGSCVTRDDVPHYHDALEKYKSGACFWGFRFDTVCEVGLTVKELMCSSYYI